MYWKGQSELEFYIKVVGEITTQICSISKTKLILIEVYAYKLLWKEVGVAMNVYLLWFLFFREVFQTKVDYTKF